MNLWDGSYRDLPEQKMRKRDWAIFAACLVFVVAIGVFAAGGPSL